ncbi:DUF4097 family beta strand repeat-containing protein [Massilioclostridium coli]|uniref:DUF4097 family beta strand repeat-containing protein n=1 Tax=Massilioclostridium coli TaxID=1870991 RepID=UPI0022E4A7B2|nr:DUF4097 family beta strand repeat-containing protein [Massilioclostridium coli]
MKRSMKIVWTVIGVIFGVGLILTGIGYTMGASKHIVLNTTGVHAIKGDTKVISDQQQLEKFTSISIDTRSASVKLEPSDHYGIETHYQDNNETITWEIKDDCLTVQQSENYHGLNWDFSFINAGSPYYWGEVTIYYPSDANFQTTTVVSGGNITIAGLKTDGLTLEGDSATFDLQDVTTTKWENKLDTSDISANHVTTTKLVHITNNGDTSFSNCMFEMIEGSIEDGNLDMVSCQTKGMQIINHYGDMDLTGDFQGITSLNAVEGDVTLHPTMDSSSYGYQLESAEGCVEINGIEQPQSISQNMSSQNQIRATVEYGDISIAVSSH